MNISVNEVTEKLVKAIRKEAENQKIDQGAIAICYESVRGITNEWLGLPQGAISNTVTFPIIPGEDTIYRKDNKEVGDCAGVVAMKIAAVRRVFTEVNAKGTPTLEECTSGALPDELVGNGRINWKGAIVMSVGALYGGACGNAGTEALRVYVSVSGDTQDQDETTAWAALPALREILAQECGWMLARYLIK